MSTELSAPAQEEFEKLEVGRGEWLAYRHTPARGAGLALPGVMFLSGFMSDMTGTKAVWLEGFCRDRGLEFTRFDYQGHGASSGAFRDGTIGLWTENALAVLDRVTERPPILVGSSMGGWIMLLAALKRPEKIKALVGIASAPDFTEKLLWAGFDEAARREVMEQGVHDVPSCYAGGAPYSITRTLIEEGRRHLLLDGPIPIRCPVRLLQGMKDEDVPWRMALTLAEKLESEDVELHLVKNGAHRMSEPENLALLGRALEGLLGAL